jgi:hypothetical protein
VDDHIDTAEPAGQHRIPDVHHAPDDAGELAAVVIHRDYPAEPVRLRQSRRQREPKVVGGSGDGDYRPVSSAGPVQVSAVQFSLVQVSAFQVAAVQVSVVQFSVVQFSAIQFSAVRRGFAARLKARASLPGTGSAAPPSANLGYSVAHREALLG